jgi:hypothetical protein
MPFSAACEALRHPGTRLISEVVSDFNLWWIYLDRNPRPRLGTNEQDPPIGSAAELKLRLREPLHLLDLGPAHLGTRPQNLSLRLNLLPHKFRLVA